MHLPRRSIVRSARPSRAAIRIRRAAGAALVLVAGCQRDITSPITPEAPLSPAAAQRALTGATAVEIFPNAAANGLRGDARGLNASGQVTGALLDLYGVADAQPYRWTPGAGSVLLTGVCCGTAWGSDINDAGVIAGTSQTSFISGVRAFRGVGTTMTKLDTLPGSTVEGDTRAYAINSSGQIVGDASTASYHQHAVLWSPTNAITDLGTLGGSFSSATDINDAGQVIGTSYLSGDVVQHFFIWSSSTGMRDLNTMLGSLVALAAINDAGQIAGTIGTSSGNHAFLYTPGSGVKDLGTLGGATSSATGLNDKGQVVGMSTTSSGVSHAFLWTPTGGMEDITAITGIPDVHLLNDALQTLTGRTDFTRVLEASPRLVQLSFSGGNTTGSPVASFTATCKTRQCTFDASASTDDKGIVLYSWSWGTGRAEAHTTPITKNTFPKGGRYEVKLTVTDADGHIGTVTKTVTVPDGKV
jgi:probable HAF family extracellular repeat protein